MLPSMRRLRRSSVLVALAAAVASALLASPASATPPRKAYCSPTGDYCTSVYRTKAGAIRLRIATFSFRGRYRLCVVAPKRAKGKRLACKRFRLRRRGSLYVSDVGWRRHFPHKGRGIYRVAWFKFGNRLGPRLGFKI
jgi:hypothetical protein